MASDNVHADLTISFITDKNKAYSPSAAHLIAVLGFFEQAFGPGLDVVVKRFGVLEMRGCNMSRLVEQVEEVPTDA